MKFATSKEQRDFFQKNGWIEFEEMLSNDQLALMNQALDQVIAARLNVAPEKLGALAAEKIYLQGHDVWRSHPFLQKIATQTRLAEIGAGLIEKKILRLGYDQFFLGPPKKSHVLDNRSLFYQFLEKTTSLETVSCLQGVTCGLVFALGGNENVFPEEKPSSFETHGMEIFPSQAGHAIFFQSHLPIHWSRLFELQGQRFYLIVYTNPTAHYQLQPEDPHTHALKRLGYIINDKLNDKLNPIVYRS